MISAILFASSVAFANNVDSATGGESKSEIKNKVTEIVMDGALAESLGLSGQANVWFMVDDNNRIHVEGVETSDYLSEYHIRQSLEGALLQVKESFIGKTFAVVINFVQSK